MEKIKIFEDLMNKIQREENRNHILFGDSISTTNGSTLNHNIMYHIEDRKDRMYYNGTMKEMREVFHLIIPVLKYEKGYTKKMNDVSHEYMLTGCKMIMVAGKKPRLFKIKSGINAYSHDEIEYDVVNRADFFKDVDNAHTLEKMLGSKIKELGKVYF